PSSCFPDYPIPPSTAAPVSRVIEKLREYFERKDFLTPCLNFTYQRGTAFLSLNKHRLQNQRREATVVQRKSCT
ncbi:MAG: hypothetical protein K2R98_13950, partial [Gemmataceae bacterium]|nr:hypothetical protein [Gemmataceae bacterium]